MNQIFSFQRFALLVGKHWAENKKRYMLSVAAFVGLLLLWFVFVMLTDSQNPMHPGLQYITYYFSLFLVGPFYASLFFRDLNSRPKGINYLLTPASTLEKTLCSIFYAIILLFVVFTLAFYLVDSIAVAIANALHPSYNTPQNGIIPKASVINVFYIMENERFNVSKVFLLIFLAVQSFALLGSVYFGRYSYIKTAITISLLFLLFFLIETLLMNKFMPPGGFYGGIGTYMLSDESNTGKVVKLPVWVTGVVTFLIQYAFPPIFWITTYFRLKEKEI